MSKRKGAEPLAKDRAINSQTDLGNTYSSKSTGSQPKKRNVDWALEYAAMEWHVFPVHYVLKDGGCSCKAGKDCDRLGKHPANPHGLLEASTNIEQIKSWWKDRPNYNIGLATGHAGLQVIDIDVSDGKVGAQSLAKLTDQNGPLPETRTQKTGSGGTHYFFHSDTPFKNSANKIGQHIDSRGKGGYVILPPSNHSTGGRYTWTDESPIAELPDWLGANLATEDAEPVAGKKGKKPKAGKVDACDDSGEKFSEEDLKGLSLTKQDVIKLLAVIPADERETWWKVGAAIKNEWDEDGFDIWDEWSQTVSDPKKYDPRMQQRQWASFQDKGITLGTIVHFAKENGWKGFDAEAADSPELIENWLYVIGTERFINLKTMQELKKEQFHARYAMNFKRGKADDHALRNSAFTRVDSITYWPEHSKIIDEDGLRKLNLWRPSGVSGEPGDVVPFLDHIAYLFPDETEQNIILDYMAFQVQYPGQKVHWALLIQGLPGNGKSYIGRVMECVLGKHNVRHINSDTLHENFTGWQKETQFVIVEEMMAKGRTELMNKLKPMITEPWCSIREMYKPPYEQYNRFNFLFLTNHDDAIVIDKSDRRYCVLHSLAPPHPEGKKYYKKLFDWTDEHSGRLLYCLQHRDLSDFAPTAHAPMTKAKQDLIDDSMPPLDQFIKERVESIEWPFNVDLVRSCDLAPVLPEFGLRNYTPQAVGKALKRLEYANLGKKRFDKDTDTKWPVWAVRNYSTYRKMKTAQLIQMFVNQQKDAGRPSDADILSAHKNTVMASKPENPVKLDQPM